MKVMTSEELYLLRWWEQEWFLEWRRLAGIKGQ
jgi:hypothetical protein